MKSLLLSFIIVFSFTMCSSLRDKQVNGDTAMVLTPGENDTVKDPISLTGSYRLIQMPGSDTSWAKVPVLDLDVENEVFSGNAGCNGMRGTFHVSNDTIIFNEDIITTKMGCPGNYDEKVFLNNLIKVNNYSVSGSMLQLKQADTLRLVFERRPI